MQQAHGASTLNAAQTLSPIPKSLPLTMPCMLPARRHRVALTLTLQHTPNLALDLTLTFVKYIPRVRLNADPNRVRVRLRDVNGEITDHMG